MRVDLGGGDWAELKDGEQVTNGDRKAALAHYMANGGDGDVAPHAWAGEAILLDGYLRVMLTGWSLESPLPSVDVGVLDRLTLDQSNRLYAAVKPLMAASRPDFSPDQVRDPKAGDVSSAG